MPKRPNWGDEQMVRLALSLIDLRAHFEAQLRSVNRAEQRLRRCQSTRGTAEFEGDVAALDRDLRVLSDNNRSARAVLDQTDADIHVLRAAPQRRVDDE
jgi:hypothetical protein